MKQPAQPKALKFKPGESVEFALNEHYEQMAIAAATDRDFIWKHSLVERLALAAYLRARLGLPPVKDDMQARPDEPVEV